MPEPDYLPETMPIAAPQFAPEPEPETAADPVPSFDPVAAAAAAAMPRRGLSADLAEMLREEAAREAEARAAEAPANPPELPSINDLSDDQRSEEVRRRTARLRGEEPSAPAKTATAATRRELLPDIEKINSSLRPATEYGTMDTTAEPAVQARKRGARFGFTTVMLIVAILVGLYIGAPKLSTLVPAAEPVLTRYVAVVNDVRLWIDLKMQAFIADQSGPTPESPATETPATEVPVPEGPATETPTAPVIDPAPVAPTAPATDQTNG